MTQALPSSRSGSVIITRHFACSFIIPILWGGAENEIMKIMKPWHNKVYSKNKPRYQELCWKLRLWCKIESLIVVASSFSWWIVSPGELWLASSHYNLYCLNSAPSSHFWPLGSRIPFTTLYSFQDFLNLEHISALPFCFDRYS